MVASILTLLFFILELVTAWKVFEKYGEAGWKGLIPVYSEIVEYGKVWTMPMGIVAGILSVVTAIGSQSENLVFSIAAIVYFVISIIFSNKKAKAFGKGIGLTLVLIFFPFIGNLYIGFKDDVKYLG